jgi:hypothetical protein
MNMGYFQYGMDNKVNSDLIWINPLPQRLRSDPRCRSMLRYQYDRLSSVLKKELAYELVYGSEFEVLL